ncbi:hypothetical protein [Methylomonas koyamae]|uniref:hypothetical protein n=1 Tax=Methylomonas koyamae TaxID=702114 RepID=UPI0012F6A16B|nr:hypothetical protein [Methylomonas koyamae]
MNRENSPPAWRPENNSSQAARHSGNTFHLVGANLRPQQQLNSNCCRFANKHGFNPDRVCIALLASFTAASGKYPDKFRPGTRLALLSFLNFKFGRWLAENSRRRPL